MTMTLKMTGWGWAVAAGMLATGEVLAATTGAYLSPENIVAAPDGKLLYITEQTARQVAVVDAASGKVAKTISLKQDPTGLAISADGKILCVTTGVEEGLLYIINPAKGKVRDYVEAGHSPCAPAVSPDGKTAYFCNRFKNSVAVLDVEAEKITASIPVVREPVATALTPDGKLLFVVNLMPTGRADTDYVAAAVSVIDTAARKVAATLTLPNGSSSLRGIAVSPDGRFAYVTHTLSRYQLPTTQLERGWMNTSAVTVINVATRTVVNTVLLDDVNLGAANPWGVGCSADGKTLLVAHAGTRELSLIDRTALHDKLAKVAKGEKVSTVSLLPEDVQGDLSFLTGIRERIRLPGVGPRGLAVADHKVYVAEYFSDSLAAVNLATPAAAPVKIALGREPKIDLIRRGEIMFNDATVCFQQWQSCISCHPDVRTDALNWDLLNDGIGNPKQSKSLLLSHRTPPVMLSGVRESAEKAVRSGMKFILFATIPEEDAVAIDAYCRSLKPVPSPYLVNGKLSAAAKRGEKLFVTAECAKCHPAPLFTDLRPYDVGTGTGIDEKKLYDTPTLVECWRTAPYLCDGRSGTMKEMLTRDNPGDKHGKTSKLTPAEIDDLAEYILSL